jgi:hypothetical protein
VVLTVGSPGVRAREPDPDSPWSYSRTKPVLSSLGTLWLMVAARSRTAFGGAGWFLFLSRHFEHTADAGAVALTGNPETKISALLKLSHLNLMPIQWGKVTGSWLTHPSTLQRVQRMAAETGMPTEQLHQILDRNVAPTRQAARAPTGLAIASQGLTPSPVLGRSYQHLAQGNRQPPNREAGTDSAVALSHRGFYLAAGGGHMVRLRGSL